MTGRSLVARPPAIPSFEAFVATAAIAAAFTAGVALGFQLRIGLAIIALVCFTVLVLVDLSLAIAVWLAVIFLEDLQITWVFPLAGPLLIGMGWLGQLRAREGVARHPLVEHRAVIAGCVLFLAWLTTSLLWSRDPERGLPDLGFWALGLGVFVVVMTAMSTRRAVLIVAGAFVAGAILSVIVGFAASDSLGDIESGTTATSIDGRLGGGNVNPNDLAIALVPGIVLGAGLAGSARRPEVRIALLAGIAVLAAGLAATESRGGFVAAIAALVVALLVTADRRAYVVAAALFLAGAGGVWFATTPNAWERITTYDDGGSGRSELWRVGSSMYADNPLGGVGINQFELHSSAYVDQIGGLEYVELIAERRVEMHNIYLELLAETGPLGLLLFLFLIAACLRAAFLAGPRLDAVGMRGLGTLARAVTVAIFAVATALFFSSNYEDLRLWVLFAMGPALLALAGRGGDAGGPLSGRPGARILTR